MLEKLKSLIGKNPTLRRWSLTARHRLLPTVMDQCATELSKRTRSITDPVFVKIGGNDRLDNGPFADVILGNEKWTGVLIEPNPFLFEILKATHEEPSRFAVEHAVINAASGFRRFFYVSDAATECLPNLPYWHDRFGSFNKQDMLRCLGGALEPFIAEVQIALKPLSEVLARHGVRRIDFLLVEASGEDLQVLKTVDFATSRPAAILIEHKHLSGSDRIELRTLLELNNYAVRDCRTAFFAVTQPA